MSFLKSVFFGSEGSYRIFGIDVSFEKKPSFYSSDSSSEPLDTLSIFKKATRNLFINCINSKAFNCAMHSWVHVFAHEMGHALTGKWLLSSSAKIRIFTNHVGGMNTYAYRRMHQAPLEIQSTITTAGPLVGMAFSSCELVAAVALKNYISWPVALFMGTGASYAMFCGLCELGMTLLEFDGSDFQILARDSKKHFVIASAAVVAECALGICAAKKFS